MSGKLGKPVMVKNVPGLPDGPKLTEAYEKSLDRKGILVTQYIGAANTMIALEKARKMYNGLGYATANKEQSNKFYQMGRDLYALEKKEFERFQKTATPEFDLYLLSEDYTSFKDYKPKWDTFQD